MMTRRDLFRRVAGVAAAALVPWARVAGPIPTFGISAAMMQALTAPCRDLFNLPTPIGLSPRMDTIFGWAAIPPTQVVRVVTDDPRRDQLAFHPDAFAMIWPAEAGDVVDSRD